MRMSFLSSLSLNALIFQINPLILFDTQSIFLYNSFRYERWKHYVREK